MKLIKLFGLLSFCLVLLTSCEQAPPAPATVEEQPAVEEPAKPDLAQIRTEIQNLENGYAAALNAKDAAAVMSYYADDAVSLPDDMPMVSGKAAIQKMQEEDIAKNKDNHTYAFEVVDIFAEGNLVVEVGKTTVKDAKGNVSGTGKYMSVFEKRDGKYLCVREIYNNDKKK